LISGKTTLLRKALLIISGYSLAIFAGSYLVTQLCGLLNFPLAEESGIKRAGTFASMALAILFGEVLKLFL